MATRYVLLLRGINVGRGRRVSMQDLRALLAGLGYTDVATLLQSGNAVFTSTRRQADKVCAEVEQAIVGKVDVESMAGGRELVVVGRDRRLDGTLDRHLLAHERDLPLRGAGDVDQLLDQVAHPGDLALEDFAQANQDRVGALERSQHACRVGDRRQRVAQLVRQHRQELALASLGQAQLLGALGERLLELLALMDVDAAADVADRGAVGADPRHAVVEHPAVLAVVAAHPQVHREWRARFEAGGADAEAAVEVFRVDHARPAVAEKVVQAAAGVGAPRRAEPIVAAVQAGAPDQDRRCGDEPGRLWIGHGVHLLRLDVDAGSLCFAWHGQPWFPVAPRAHARGLRRQSACRRRGVQRTALVRRSPRRPAGGRPFAGAPPKPPSAAGDTW